MTDFSLININHVINQEFTVFRVIEALMKNCRYDPVRKIAEGGSGLNFKVLANFRGIEMRLMNMHLPQAPSFGLTPQNGLLAQ